MTTSYWNWSWVAAKEDTQKDSESIDQSGGIFYNFRAATRGGISAAELNTFANDTASNINQQWRLWQNNIRPIIDSLPAGDRDQRWRIGKGLPYKIDALNYGVQGTTLFVFNDADSTKASGKYWHDTDERPITIAEAIENIWYAIDNLDIESSTSPENVDLSAVWAAIGIHYYDPSLASSATSLDSRTSVLEGDINQLSNDIYGASAGYGPWNFGVPLNYSLAENIYYLLNIHGVTNWQDDPSEVSHGSFSPSAHNHAYTQILPMPSSSLTQGRVAPYTSLDNDIKRIRYEIQRTRGSSSWYTDATDPVTSTYADLQTHINYSGSGSQTATNPHGINYIDTGASTVFTNIARFIGMTSYTSAVEMPTYSSTNYVTQASNIETAISDLDDAIASAISGFVTKLEYGPYDRSGLSDTERVQTPITIEHNTNEEPIVQVLDLSPDMQESWGMYTSPTSDYQIDYPDSNTIRIWTNAEIVKVLVLVGSGYANPVTATDHGSLSGLGDDDHTLYFLANGNRIMTGSINLGGYSLRTTSGSLKFNDSYNVASTWSQTYIDLTSSSAEWDTFETNFGEVSLFNAINQTYTYANALTATYIGYGDGSNLLTGESGFTWNTSTKIMNVTGGITNITTATFGSAETAAAISSGSVSYNFQTTQFYYTTVGESVSTVSFTTPHGLGRFSIRVSFTGSYTYTGFSDVVWGDVLGGSISGSNGEDYIIALEYRGSSTGYFGIITGPFT
jgi:hypothetical protein